MTDRMTFRTFPTAFKLAAIKRLDAGKRCCLWNGNYGDSAGLHPVSETR
jgi:hypothetical protein